MYKEREKTKKKKITTKTMNVDFLEVEIMN